MKIYRHTFNEFRNEIETVEIEVEEKPKTYVVVNRQIDVWESRLSKDDIGVFNNRLNHKMFTLTPERKPYIKALIANKEDSINRLKSRLDDAVKMKDFLTELLRKEDEE